MLADHHRFLDVFFDNIFSDLSVQSRIVEALATCRDALEAVDEQLAGLDAHRGRLVGRRSEAERARQQQLAAPQ